MNKTTETRRRFGHLIFPALILMSSVSTVTLSQMDADALLDASLAELMQLEVVEVTARKKREDLQTVPVSVCVNLNRTMPFRDKIFLSA
jgi:hypothetical protein